MPALKMIPWDATKVFPEGIDATTRDNKTEAFDEFSHSLTQVLIQRGRFLATLPLAEPGRALIVCYVEDSDDPPAVAVV